MKVTLDKDAVETIERIINAGDKAVVQRTAQGYIIMEERRKIKYDPTARRQ